MSPRVVHVVESWRPVATGYTSRGWNIVEHQVEAGIALPHVLVSSRQRTYGHCEATGLPGASVSVCPTSRSEQRWRRLRRWQVDRAALADAIVAAAQDAALIHVHWASGIGGAAADAAERLGKPLVAEVRFDLAGAFSSETMGLPVALERLLRRRFEAHLPRAARIVAASHSLARLLRQEFPALRDRIDVVPNGVSRTGPIERTASAAVVTVGTTANMLRYEGLGRLIEAARGLPGIRLLFVGDGSERLTLERQARQSGVEAEFTGRIPPEAVPAQLARMDVFVVPRLDTTITRYASPIKLVEAMGAGLPVVGSAVGDVGDLLSEGRGIALPAGDLGALRQALSSLAGDPARRRAIGAEASSWVQEALPWPKIVQTYRSVYAAALAAA